MCAWCERTGERHEAEVRERHGESTGKVKGRGRGGGEGQEREWVRCGGREAGGRGLEGRKIEKIEDISSKSGTARCKVIESISVKDGEVKWETTGLERRSGRARR